MDFIIELILEIVLEGMMEGASSRKVPLALRILLAFALLAFFGGIVGLFFFIAVQSKSAVMFAVAVFVLVLFVWAAIKKVKEFKSSGKN